MPPPLQQPTWSDAAPRHAEAHRHRDRDHRRRDEPQNEAERRFEKISKAMATVLRYDMPGLVEIAELLKVLRVHGQRPPDHMDIVEVAETSEKRGRPRFQLSEDKLWVRAFVRDGGHRRDRDRPPPGAADGGPRTGGAPLSRPQEGSSSTRYPSRGREVPPLPPVGHDDSSSWPPTDRSRRSRSPSQGGTLRPPPPNPDEVAARSEASAVRPQAAQWPLAPEPAADHVHRDLAPVMPLGAFRVLPPMGPTRVRSEDDDYERPSGPQLTPSFADEASYFQGPPRPEVAQGPYRQNQVEV